MLSILITASRLILRLLLATLFLFAGTVHLFDPTLFLPIMPPWIPFPTACVIISGIFELLGGAGLLVPMRPVQVVTGWGLVLLLIAVFPANIYMAVEHIRVHGFPAHNWMAWARLALQPLLIAGVAWGNGHLARRMHQEGTYNLKPRLSCPDMNSLLRTQFFTHRPPTSGIHLLSDPFPQRLNGSTSMFIRAELLSEQRAFIAVSRRPALQAITKK